MDRDQLLAQVKLHTDLLVKADLRGVVFLADGFVTEFCACVRSDMEATFLLTKLRMSIDRILESLPEAPPDMLAQIHGDGEIEFEYKDS